MARLVLLVLSIVAWILLLQAAADGESGANPVGVVTSSEETEGTEPTPVVMAATSQATAAESCDHHCKSNAVAEAPEIRSRRHHEHHSSDKSVAGGGVIIGGLATATVAAVFCYIRVTRRRNDHATN